MNFFELWMDPMFFVHLLLCLAGLAGFIYSILLFKQVCEREQKQRLSGVSSSKKEKREEPEEQPEQEYSQEELPEEQQADEPEEESDSSYEKSYTDENSESEAEDTEEEEYDETEAEPEGSAIADESPALSGAASFIDSTEYDNMVRRITMTEKNLGAASKGFRELVDRLTDIEKRLNSIPQHEPVEKTDFAEAVNSALEDIKAQINELQPSEEDISGSHELPVIKQQIRTLSDKVDSIKNAAKSACISKVSELEEKIKEITSSPSISNANASDIIDALKEEIGSLKEQNASLAAEIEDIKKNNNVLAEGMKESENSKQKEENGKMEKLMEEISNLKEEIEQLPKSQQAEENSNFKTIKEAIAASEKKAKDTESRLAVLEEQLEGKFASHQYTVEVLTDLIGNIDNLNKEQIRMKLKELNQDISDSYSEEE